MSAYNLKQHLNEWTNIEVSIDNNTGTVDLFVNGAQQQFTAGANTTAATGDSKSLNISNGKQFSKNSDSKFHIGGNKDGDKEFTGKMERIEFSNKARNAASALAKYQKLKRRESDSMMNMKFNTRGNSRSLSDKSVYKSQAKFRRDDSYVGDKAVMAINTDTVRNVDREAVQFKGGDYIELDASTSMYGDKLLNSTFTSWIKTPSAHDAKSYEPIISRENVFSFGVNNGHASLFLSQNNQLAPGTNVSREASSAVTVGQAVSSVMESTHENLLVDANFNTTDTKITKPASSEYSSIIPGSKVVKLTSSDKIEVDRTALIGKNMNKFTFSGWVNFSSLNDNAVLFERPDAGLKLSTNASGQVSLDFKTVMMAYFSNPILHFNNMGSSLTDSINDKTFTITEGSAQYDSANNALVNSNDKFIINFSDLRTRTEAITVIYELYVPTGTTYQYSLAVGADGDKATADSFSWDESDNAHIPWGGQDAINSSYTSGNFANQWVKIAFIREASSGSVKYFVNGVKVVTKSATGEQNSDLTSNGVESEIRLFYHSWSSQSGVANDNIKIRNVQVYKSSFTDAEILNALG